jgi:hypothetical protein
LCSFLVVVEDLLCEFLPLAVAGEGLALQDQDPLGLQLNNSVYKLNISASLRLTFFEPSVKQELTYGTLAYGRALVK